MSTKRPHILYKYLTSSTAKIVLGTNSFRWGSPKIFNDIFDVLREFAPGFSAEEFLAEAFNRKINQDILGAGKQIDSERLKKLCSKLLSEGERKFISNQMDKQKYLWEQWVQDLRIFCMTERKDLATMWAHYAADHSGIVLGLDFRPEAHEMAWQIAEKVTYTDEPCSFATLDGLVELYRTRRNHDLVVDVCLRKKAEWLNEHEWRAVTVKRPEENGLYSDWNFDPKAVSEMILGAKMAQEEKNEFINLFRIRYPHASIQQAVPKPSGTIEFKSAYSL
jgi:hypothetical protein